MFRKKDSGESRQLLEGVSLTSLVHGDKTLMGQFKIAKGSAVPAHSHPHEQTGMMISGKVRFNVDGEISDVDPEIAGACRAVSSIRQRPWRIR